MTSRNCFFTAFFFKMSAQLLSRTFPSGHIRSPVENSLRNPSIMVITLQRLLTVGQADCPDPRVAFEIRFDWNTRICMVHVSHFAVNLQETHRRHGHFRPLSTFRDHISVPSSTPDKINLPLFVVKFGRENGCVLPSFFLKLFKFFL